MLSRQGTTPVTHGVYRILSLSLLAFFSKLNFTTLHSDKNTRSKTKTYKVTQFLLHMIWLSLEAHCPLLGISHVNLRSPKHQASRLYILLIEQESFSGFHPVLSYKSVKTIINTGSTVARFKTTAFHEVDIYLTRTARISN